MTVKGGTNRAEPGEECRNKVVGLDHVVKRNVAQPFLLDRVGGFGDPSCGFGFHGGSGLSGVFGHQVVVHATASP